MKISDSLKELAEVLPAPLYVVGGAVRDYLAGFPVKDVDLASPLAPDTVVGALKGTRFKALPTSLKLGTLKILAGEESYEYTAFRRDSYPEDGSHAPSKVSFTSDITEDALRRDFTVNSVYYDIKAGRLIDPLGGIKDIQNKLIKTAASPEKVFREDALRVLRGIRIAAETGFEIEENTLAALSAYAAGLKKIAAERLREELNRIITADLACGVKGGHIRGVRLLDSTGALMYVIPELAEGKGIVQRADFHRYDVFEHALHVYEASPPEVRLAALLHDIAKPKIFKETGRFAGHDKAGADMTVSIMRRLVYPEAEIRRIKELVSAHMYDLDNRTGEKKLRLFILEHHAVMEDLIKLKRADIEGGGIVKGDIPLRIEDTYREMLREGVAFSVKDLPISGKDLVDIGVPPLKRGEILEELLRRSVNEPALRNRETALNFARNFK